MKILRGCSRGISLDIDEQIAGIRNIYYIYTEHRFEVRGQSQVTLNNLSDLFSLYASQVIVSIAMRLSPSWIASWWISWFPRSTAKDKALSIFSEWVAMWSRVLQVFSHTLDYYIFPLSPYPFLISPAFTFPDLDLLSFIFSPPRCLLLLWVARHYSMHLFFLHWLLFHSCPFLSPMKSLLLP